MLKDILLLRNMKLGGMFGKRDKGDKEVLQATADVTALSTTTHADGLSSHLLSLTLRNVSCEIRIGGMERRTGCSAETREASWEVISIFWDWGWETSWAGMMIDFGVAIVFDGERCGVEFELS